jgi:hypothetical protein
MGTATHPGFCPAVSLEDLPTAHLRVLLDGQTIFEQYGLLLAGGYSFRAHDLLHRPSTDLDFATRDGAPLSDIAVDVMRTYVAAGYGARLMEGTGRYARLVLEFPDAGGELELDLLKEALGPGWVTVQTPDGTSVRALSLDDAVGLKARAWFERFVIRDIIDLNAVRDVFSFADLENLARRHDPGVDLETLLDHLAGVGVWSDEEFAEYGLDASEVLGLRRWATAWYDDLARRLAADDPDDDY